MSWVVWLGLAVALGAVEVATVDFVFVMLAGGALAGAVTSAAGGPLPVQVVVAAAVAMLLLGLVRPVIKRRFTVRNPEPMGAAAHHGREALVVETVTARGGQVKLVGELWSARAEDPSAHFPPGTTVVVVSVDGATVVVAGSAA